MSPTNPIYLDWQFWSAIAAFIALVLSQFPPIKLWFRPQNLEVEVHSRIQITHKVGNPNVGMFVSIRNTGGRQLRVRSLRIILTREKKPLAEFMAQNYLETPSASFPVLMVPFSLKPEETWSHMTNFYNPFDRATEKLYREYLSALQEDIQQKIKAKQSNDHELVEADPKLVTPFMTLFDKLYVWNDGEYVAELIVDTEQKDISFRTKYRFTLFESDTADLKKHTEDYKFGGGIAYNIDKHIGLFVPITRHEGE